MFEWYITLKHKSIKGLSDAPVDSTKPLTFRRSFSTTESSMMPLLSTRLRNKEKRSIVSRFSSVMSMLRVPEALEILVNKNMKNCNNIYLNTFQEFVDIMEGIEV